MDVCDVLRFLVLGCLPCVKGAYSSYSSYFEENILFNKTSTQNYAWKGNFDGYGPSFGNDGEVANMVGTGLSDESFWQADLQGYYMINNITLTSTYAGWVWNDHLRNAYIGVSVLDKTCPGSDVIICGQWPNETLTSATRTFSCDLSHPVRFVKVWKGVIGHLGFSEVKATGKKTEMDFVLLESLKVSTILNSLTVAIAAECASNCFYTEQCIAFSFRQGGLLNCLLSAETSTISDSGWDTYTIKDFESSYTLSTSVSTRGCRLQNSTTGSTNKPLKIRLTLERSIFEQWLTASSNYMDYQNCIVNIFQFNCSHIYPLQFDKVNDKTRTLVSFKDHDEA